MPAFWQITKLRAEQTSSVWNLDAAFKAGQKTRADLTALLTGYTALIDAVNTAESADSQATTAKNQILEELEVFAIKGAGKMSADLEDDDGLDVALRQKVFSINPQSEADLILRAEALVPIWTEYDAQLGSSGPFLIRGKSLTDFQTALSTYDTLAATEKSAGTTLSTAGTALEQHNRLVDRLIKKWYAAWKLEYPEGTPEGDALLSQVEPESGQQRPTKLEIAALTNVAGHKVKVDFVPGGGAHATLRFLQVQVLGVDGAFATVQTLSVADVAAGVEIGPFTAGQTVKVRTDVGNSRDPSEISTEVPVVVT